MTLPADFKLQERSFARDLRRRRRKPKTITVYGAALTILGEWLDSLPDEAELDDVGAVVLPAAPATLDQVTRQHMKCFFGDLGCRTSERTGKLLSDAYIDNIFRALQAFWKWMAVEEIIEYSPMTNLQAPDIAEKPVPVVTVDKLSELVATCGKGRRRSFRDVRDEALLRFMIDTGVRVSETLIAIDAIDTALNFARVTGKKGKTRDVPFGDRTAQALDTYLYARTAHTHADLADLWLGRWGAMTSSGVYQTVVRRGKLVGLDLHPHQFRHTLAHEWRLNGGEVTELMRIMGWDSRTMADRYGASAADERARRVHKTLRLGDRI